MQTKQLILLSTSFLFGLVFVRRVRPTIQTPLMTFMGALSGITIIPAYQQSKNNPDTVWGYLAIFFGTFNLVCGIFLTYRILSRFVLSVLNNLSY